MIEEVESGTEDTVVVNGEKVLHGADTAEAKLGSLGLSLEGESGSIPSNKEVDLADRFKHRLELVTSYMPSS